MLCAVNHSLLQGIKLTKLIPFKKEHLECMDIREHEQVLLSNAAHLEALENSIAKTGIIEGRIIACGGILPFMNGNGELWLIPSIYVADHKLTFLKVIKAWIDEVAENLALRRMQSNCIDDGLHCSWMAHLGFQREGTLRNYFNGKDYAVWGRLWG